MMFSGDYTGCRIFINSADRKKLGEGLIVDQNRDYMTISVQGDFGTMGSGEFVNVLILADGSVHEYQGKTRRSPVNAQITELALSKGKTKESRTARRYAIDSAGQVDGLIVNESPVQLLHSIDVTVVNLSTIGLLLKAPLNCFPPDCVLTLRMSAGKDCIEIAGRVVRIRELDESAAEYGCELLSVH